MFFYSISSFIFSLFWFDFFFHSTQIARYYCFAEEKISLKIDLKIRTNKIETASKKMTI